MKVIYLLGIPGTGKTTVMREFMDRFNREWQPDRPIELLDTMVNVTDDDIPVTILGKYHEGEVFAGTDRLSMAVAPKAIEWISSTPMGVIVGEGDRLTNKAFFEACGDDLTIIHLTVSDAERKRRYEKRGSNQPESFIKTCRTKCKNIVDHFGDHETLFGTEEGCVEEYAHETADDSRKIVDRMFEIIKSE